MYAFTRSLIRFPSVRQGIRMMGSSESDRWITMRLMPAAKVKPETYIQKNERLRREISPHLSIYKPQLTSVLSITHRATGLAITCYAWVLGLAALVTSFDMEHIVTTIEDLELSSTTLLIMKGILAFPFAFHTCSGLRHLIWDAGQFLKIKQVYATGYVAIVGGLALSAYLATL